MRHEQGLARTILPGLRTNAVDFWLQKLNRRWSVDQILADVTGIEDVYSGLRTVTLRPNARWTGFRAGQHVRVTFQVGGRALTRTWTVASGESERGLRLTIARIPDGTVTGHVHEGLAIGDVVRLTPATGELVLPDGDAPVVFLAAGSGVTPALSMLRTLHARRDARAFTLIHYVRSDAHRIAADELAAISASAPNLLVLTIATDDDQPNVEERRVNAQHLRDAGVPPDAQWMMCGPAAFMRAAAVAIDTVAPGAPVASETFAPPVVPMDGESAPLRFVFSEKTGTNEPGQTLLEAAESAGLTPRFGCRAGICHECSCIKRSGVVRDIRTGLLMTEENQRIQICITQAVSAVELDI